MNKAYTRINFQNAPSTATPLNAENLNKIDKAINDLDDRIIELAGYQEEAQEAAEQASSSASAAAKAAETAVSDAEERVNAIIEGLEVYTKAEADNKFAPIIKQVATGSPILIKDNAGNKAYDFKAYGRSTQDGTPTPDSPIDIESVADSGWFDGELLQGRYNDSGVFVSQADNVCSKNAIPCKERDKIKFIYETVVNTICYCFYDENMTIVGRPYISNVKEYEVIAPTNAKYVNFHFNSPSVTPTNAKKIVVTINGKYAIIVKSRGKNLLKNTATTQTINGITFTVNDDGSVSTSGKATAQSYISSCSKMPIPKGKYVLSGCPSGGSISTYRMQATLYEDSTSYHYNNGEDLVFEVTDDDATITVQSIVVNGVSADNLTFKPMIRPLGTDDTYEPYKETVSYIPLSEPLRSVGYVSDEVSPTEITRRYAEVVFNGSDDEQWLFFARTNGTDKYVITVPNSFNFTSGNLIQIRVICDKLVGCSPNDINNDTEGYKICLYSSGRIIFSLPEGLIATNQASARAWLQANPIAVVYELAEPVVETIEPVDIATYNSVTYITATDNADMEVTYATDTKTYIDNKFAELQAAIVATGANV